MNAKWKVSVEITTPVHIGSGEKLANGVDFFEVGNNIFVIDIEKLGEYAVKTGNYSLLRNPADALRTWGLQPSTVAKRSVPIASPVGDHLADIREQIRDGNGRPYIAGTSIKGAIRTALLWEMVITTDNNDNLVTRNEYVNALTTILNRRNVRKNRADPPVIRKAFRGYVPSDRKHGDDPKFDIMKAFYVSDCYFSESDVAIYTVATWDIGRNGYGWWVFRKGPVARNPLGGTLQYIEAIRPGAKGEFEITLNLAYIDRFRRDHGWSNQQVNQIKDWIRNLADYFLIKLDNEYNFFDELGFPIGANWYDQRYDEQNNFPSTITYFRVGWGGGWIFTTGDWIVSDNLLNQTRRVFRMGRPNAPFPKTKRFVVMRDNAIIPPGWMKLDIKPTNPEAKALTPKQTQTTPNNQ